MNGASVEIPREQQEGPLVRQVKVQQTVRVEVEQPNPHEEFKPHALCHGGYCGKGWVLCGVFGLCPNSIPTAKSPG